MRHIKKIDAEQKLLLSRVNKDQLSSAEMKADGSPDVWCVGNCHWDCYSCHSICHLDCFIGCF